MTQVKRDNSELPVPDQTALLQSEKLSDHIRKLIEQEAGSISFERYMSACLYEAGLGYYSAGSHKIGKQGDFITAPEISPLFAKCLANQCLEILRELENPIILELGAGSGRMALDILLALEEKRGLPAEYWILELSADLKQRQQMLLKERIPHLYERIKWLDVLPEERFTCIILGNEVLDAMPVCRFIKTADCFNELQVQYVDDKFAWQKVAAASALSDKLRALETRLQMKFSEYYVSELNLGLDAWLQALQLHLEHGVILFIDYGYAERDYYHAKYNDGHLLCHYRHFVHADPFYYPGLQDITASVNFTAVAEAAHALALDVAGYTTQNYFLLANGLEHFVADSNDKDIKQQIEMAQQVRLLTLPEEMGDRFKVMALGTNY